jgi:hypothetical protein
VGMAAQPGTAAGCALLLLLLLLPLMLLVIPKQTPAGPSRCRPGAATACTQGDAQRVPSVSGPQLSHNSCRMRSWAEPGKDAKSVSLAHSSSVMPVAKAGPGAPGSSRELASSRGAQHC